MGASASAREVGMTIHPRESRYGRREFIRRSAAGVIGLSSLSTILAACGGSDNGNFTPPELQIASPQNPVKWPLFDDNPMIASGLEPESGTLRIYNWNGYLWPRIKKDFAKEYGVKVEETYFSTTDEAVAKISSGAIDFDVFFPTTDRIGRLVVGKALQPLNRDVSPESQERLGVGSGTPGTTEARSTRSRTTTWTTGIGYRTDKVAKTPDTLSNPYEIYWDDANRGKVYLLDDSRDAPAHMLLKNGITDVNTEKTGRHRSGEERAQVADRRRQREALDRRLHEPARRQGVDPPDVVGERDLGSVVPARGHRAGGARLLVPDGRPRASSGAT